MCIIFKLRGRSGTGERGGVKGFVLRLTLATPRKSCSFRSRLLRLPCSQCFHHCRCSLTQKQKQKQVSSSDWSVSSKPSPCSWPILDRVCRDNCRPRSCLEKRMIVNELTLACPKNTLFSKHLSENSSLRTDFF